jgi:hypothetical protein
MSYIRLTVALLVMLVTALDVEFGRADAVLQIAALTAGALLVASVIIDRFLLHGNGGEAHGVSRPAEPHEAAPGAGELPSNPGSSR